MSGAGQVVRSSALAALSVLAVGLPATGPAAAQEAEAVVDQHVAALGGADRIDALVTLRKTGTYTYNGLEHPIVVMVKRGAGCREEIEGLSTWGTAREVGTTTIRAWDGSDAWVGVRGDDLEVSEMPEGEAAGFVLDGRIAGSLVDAKAEGGTVSLVGPAEVEGVPVVQLEVASVGGAVEQWYLDRQTLLPVMKSTEVPDSEYKAAMTWYFDDYREVAGVLMPFYILIEERLFSREYLFDAIEANVPLDAALFAKPEGAPAAE